MKSKVDSKSIKTPSKAIPLRVGDLTQAKKEQLSILRERYLAVSNMAVDSIYNEEFLLETNVARAFIKKECVRPFMKVHAKGYLNSAYAQMAGDTVADHISEQYKRAARALCAAIHGIDREKFIKPSLRKRCIKRNEPIPKYVHISTELQDAVNESDLNAIKIAFKQVDPAKRLDWLREVIFCDNVVELSKLQVAIVKGAYAHVKERFGRPTYGEKDFSLTVHLDTRIVSSKTPYKASIDGASKHYRWLKDKTNKHYTFFLEVSNPVPRQPAIKLPISLSPKLYSRLATMSDTEQKAQAFSLIIGTENVSMRSLITKDSIDTSIESQYEQLKNSEHLVGRDFGYTDTISLSVIKNEFKLSFDEFVQRIKANKSETKAIYQNHSHTPKIVEQVSFSGKNFLSSINQITNKIDAYKSEIDYTYNKIDALVANIRGHLGLVDGELITPNMAVEDNFVKRLIAKFFRMLDGVKYLKSRLKLKYAKIRGKKKSWFGYLANVEAELVKKYNATLVVEDLTLKAAEKETPDYKGRTFNKMTNNGSKGQYMTIAQERNWWDGVLSVKVPSFYSSKTCTIHKLVEGKKGEMRKGKVFECSQCRKKLDADLHASSTIPSFLLLQ